MRWIKWEPSSSCISHAHKPARLALFLFHSFCRTSSSPSRCSFLPIRLLAHLPLSIVSSQTTPPFYSVVTRFSLLDSILLHRYFVLWVVFSGFPKDYSLWSELLSSGSVRRFPVGQFTTESQNHHIFPFTFSAKNTLCYLFFLLHHRMDTQTAASVAVATTIGPNLNPCASIPKLTKGWDALPCLLHGWSYAATQSSRSRLYCCVYCVPVRLPLEMWN